MKKIPILSGLCLIALMLMACGDLQTGVNYLMAGNTSSSGSSTDYRSIAYQDAVDAGIPPDLFVRQINQESGFNPSAQSSGGAVGIAQFLPSTAQGLGINPYDPVDALRGSAQLMSRYYAKYGSYDKALAAYNAGSGTLEWAIANCSYYVNCLPAETQRYIAAID